MELFTLKSNGCWYYINRLRRSGYEIYIHAVLLAVFQFFNRESKRECLVLRCVSPSVAPYWGFRDNTRVYQTTVSLGSRLESLHSGLNPVP